MTVVLAALLHGLAFPKFDLFFLGFVFLIPLVRALDLGKVKRAFGFFYCYSFLSYLLLLYWIPRVMVYYGHMSRPLSILGIVILAGFLSLFTGWAGWLIKKVVEMNRRRPSYALLLVMVPLIWVARDLVLERIFGGFPWCLDGYSQVKNIYFAQVAEIGGVHLLTFLLVYFNMLLYLLLKRRDRRLLIVLTVSVVGLYSAGYFLYGMTGDRTRELEVHRAGILQPDTGEFRVMSAAEKKEKLESYFKDSVELKGQGAEYVVWPEYTVSIYPLQNRSYMAQFMEYVEAHGPLIAGFTDFQGMNKIYNSVILFEPGTVEKYDKVHLTPFGEYILFREFMFFVKRITDEIGDFTPGASVRNLSIDGHKISTPSCYELIFPELVRDFIALGGEVIIITSNDSWYGDTSAPYQLLCMSVMRSIENRRYTLRSTSNGISALIAPSGEVEYQSPFGTADKFIAEYKYIKYKTIFTRFGYLFPYGCFLAVLMFFLVQIIRRRKEKRNG